MKIYILADMEGISGIREMAQVKRVEPVYSHGCELMMQDVNAAIDAAFAAGATEVVACDTHGGGGQLRLDRMDNRAIYETPNAGLMMPALDSTFAGVILLGHHARAGTLGGFLDHTMNSEAWFEFTFDGEPLGEIGIEAAYAGHFGVPVIAVTGDEATAIEARELLGDIECAVVKWGVGRNRARCLSLEKAHAAVRAAVGRGVARSASIAPYRPTLPATVRLTFNRSDMADDRAARGDVRRIDARTIERVVDRLNDIRF